MVPIKVIIPLAGKGTRMRPFTHTKAKPLLPVAGKACLDWILDCLEGLDISEYIFITGAMKEQIEAHVEARLPGKTRCIEQKVKDGTAGACRLAEPYVDEPVLILFVDTIFDADLSIIVKSQDDGIIWAKEVEDYRRFGVIVHDEKMHVTNIVEKPDKAISRLANIGLYYIRNHKLFFEGIRHVFEKDLKVKGEYFLPEAFMYMVGRGAKLRVAPVDGWYDCGKPETTLESNAVLLQRHHPVRSSLEDTSLIEPVFIDEGCTIQGCTLGPNVSIAKGCTLRNATLRDCIIDQRATVSNAALTESILGEDVVVEGNSEDRELSVLLGDHSRVRLE